MTSSTQSVGPTYFFLSRSPIPPAVSERAVGSLLWVRDEVEKIDERTRERSCLVESQVGWSLPGQLLAPARDQQLQDKTHTIITMLTTSYSGKLSRENTFVNVGFCGYTRKFSPRNLGRGVLWRGKSKQSAKIVFFTNS